MPSLGEIAAGLVKGVHRPRNARYENLWLFFRQYVRQLALAYMLTHLADMLAIS